MFAAACAEPSGEIPVAAVRDSAGITIIENDPAAGVPIWELATPPLMEIGVADGNPDYQLFRVVGAVLRPDGSVVVANAGTHELRFYDSSGTHTRTVGGEGDGPGEFRALGWVRPRADSLVALDDRLLRMSVFTPDGRFVRSVPGTAPWFGMLANGSGLSLGYDFPTERPLGLSREQAFLVVHDADGAVADTLTRVALWETYFDPALRGRFAPWFMHNTEIAVHGNDIYIADNERYEIQVMSSSGQLHRFIRKRQENRRVTPDDVDRLLQERLTAMTDPNRRRQFADAYRELPVPETMPAFGVTELSQWALPTIFVDARSRLWVKEYEPSPGAASTWAVFDPIGTMVATLVAPPALELMGATADAVVGRFRDELDVESVRVYRLVREMTREASVRP